MTFVLGLALVLAVAVFILFDGLEGELDLAVEGSKVGFPILALVLFPLLLTARPDVISQSSGRIVFFVLNCLVSPSTVIRAIMVTVPSFFGSFFFK